MRYNEKRSLYESIMKDVAKTVKRHLNENESEYEYVVDGSITVYQGDYDKGIAIWFKRPLSNSIPVDIDKIRQEILFIFKKLRTKYPYRNESYTVNYKGFKDNTEDVLSKEEKEELLNKFVHKEFPIFFDKVIERIKNYYSNYIVIKDLNKNYIYTIEKQFDKFTTDKGEAMRLIYNLLLRTNGSIEKLRRVLD